MLKLMTRWTASRLSACVVLCLSVAMQSVCAAERETIPLWASGAPGEPATKPEHEPVLLMSKPKATAAANTAANTAVIVIPGGAYSGLAIDHEGHQIADWLNSMGVTAFILKYRLKGTGHQHPIPMLDGQRAIRTVRARAEEWKIDPQKVGIIGFSAGGHLASTLGTHFDDGKPEAADAIDRISSRPDFMILCYPVITMTDDFMHKGSRENLLGPMPDEKLARSLSNDTQVTQNTPPTFLFHTHEDTAVLPENSIVFYSALRKAGVPAELHIYEKGKHGVGLARDIPGTSTWPERCREWMKSHGLLD